MKTHVCFSAFLACVLLSSCAGSRAPAPLPPSMTTGHPSNAAMRVGDKITIRLSGVPDPNDGYFNEIQIPASGDISVPLLTQPFHAAGRNGDELAADITNAYKTQKIYTNPVVTVIQEERFVNVGGDVRSPNNVLWRPDMTLTGAINSCGGFTEFANKREVTILRGQQSIRVDAVRAAQNPGNDPALMPGDQINVPRTMF